MKRVSSPWKAHAGAGDAPSGTQHELTLGSACWAPPTLMVQLMMVARQATGLRGPRLLPLDATSLAALVKLGAAAACGGAARTSTLGLSAPSV